MRVLTLASLVVVPVVFLAACTPAADDIEAAPEPTTVSVVSAEETCAELSDVGTIIFNWGVAETEGRLIDNEYAGGMRLAARILHRVPVEAGTPLAEAVHTAQGLADVGPSGANVEIIQAYSRDWQDAWGQIVEACNEQLESSTGGFGVEGWVGG